jgi:cytochrome b561
MQIKNSSNNYGIVAKSFHWIMALIIICLLCVGLYMVGLPLSSQKLKLFRWHKEFGLLILMLVILRYGWRLLNTTPVLPATMPWWQKLAAHASHWALYGFMVAMPLTGWLLTSAAGLAPSFFGLFVMPTLIAPNDSLTHLLGDIHKWLAWGLIATICAHAGAALYHYFVEKDDILQRML